MSGKTETHLVVATSTSNTGELQSGRLFLSLLPRPAVVRSRISSRSIRLVSKFRLDPGSESSRSGGRYISTSLQNPDFKEIGEESKRLRHGGTRKSSTDS